MKKILLMAVVALFGTALKAQITSFQSGDWSSPSTWVGGNIPNSTNDVIIASGHIVTVDVESSCKNISFADTSSRLGLNANLNCYGNFNRADTLGNPFYYGSSSLWTPGAKFVFKGDAATQTVTNLNINSTDPYPLRFDELVIDKSAGKFTTSAGSNNLKLGIGTSLEILNGTFELATTDDIDGRNTSGNATTPTITVAANGIFDMRGGGSHLRRGNFVTGVTTSKIGKLTVFGTAYLASSSTNRMNFTDIDIENGGVIEFPTGRSTSSNTFNAGTITIKNGGAFVNRLSTTSFWYANDTIPVAVVINNGGEYEAAATSTTIPQGGITQNSGSSFRFSSGSTTNLPAAITSYKTLILSGAGSKALNSNVTIEEALQLSGSFTTLNLNGYTLTYDASARLRYGASGQATAQITRDAEWPAVNGPANVQIYNSGGVTLHDNRTITGTLTLTLGQFDNNGSADDKVLTFGNGATISRARGSLSSAPTFGSSVNLSYTGTIENVTTGFEVPSSATVLNNLSMTSSQGITLGGNITVNGTLSFGSSAASITTGAYTLSLSQSASITGELAGRYVIGYLATTRNVGTGSSAFGGIGVTIDAGADNIGNVSVTRVSGPNGIITAGGNQSIARKWTISSDNPPTNGRILTLSWVSSDDNSKTFSASNKAIAFRFNGSNWVGVGSPTNVSSSDPRSITINTNSFSDWTISDEAAPLAVKTLNLTALIEGFYDGSNMVPDTITVELHNASSPYALVDQAKILLNLNGNATANFFNATDATNYYLAIKHRNSIETWSSVTPFFSGGIMSYNFTTAQSQAFNNNLKLKFGKWCILGGEIANEDQYIDGDDVTAAFNAQGAFGYVIQDVTGDDYVDGDDVTLAYNNQGVGTTNPLIGKINGKVEIQNQKNNE